MPADRTPVQIEASRTNGARSRGPVTEAGEDRKAFAALHAAVTSDWGPRDAYERRWVMELVNAMWRQDRLRGLELATLAAAAAESRPSEATIRKLAAFARYGARIDKDIGHALQALRVLRNRPDAWIDELQDGTPEPKAAEPPREGRADVSPSRTFEPCAPHAPERISELLSRMLECEPANADTPKPDLPALNRHQRRRLAALAGKRPAA